MPTIEIPDDIDVSLPGANPEKDVSIKLRFGRDFVCRTLLSDQRWGADMEEAFAAAEIRGAFKDAAPRDKVKIANDHLLKLQERMRKPSGPYLALVVVQLLPFFQALLKPVDE